MTGEVRFTKMHGCGNDYIYVDARKYNIENPQEASIRWSDRHKGIGADGLVLINASTTADFSMRIFNADGSEAMMCGNASRCIAKYLYDNGDLKGDTFSLETLSGIKILKLHIANNQVESVTVDMGIPTDIEPVDLGYKYPFKGIKVNMGNPHLVIFDGDPEEMDIAGIGSKLEYHPLFPDRVNVEFAHLTKEDTFRMRVWERGSGITQACGTGACATAVAAAFTGKAKRKSDIIMDGGTLSIEWNEENGHVFMTGPAVTVFSGTIK